MKGLFFQKINLSRKLFNSIVKIFHLQSTLFMLFMFHGFTSQMLTQHFFSRADQTCQTKLRISCRLSFVALR